MSISNSRRNFLRGRFSVRKGPLRPPWALEEDGFLSACTRCGDCVAVCPTKILVSRSGDYPTVDFGEGECTFCCECATACKAAALLRQPGRVPWQAKAAVGEDCLTLQKIDCRICEEPCMTRAISFVLVAGAPARPLIDPARCTGCGACVAPCPTRAITVTQS